MFAEATAFKDIVSMLFERSSAVQVYWATALTAWVGVLAFLGTDVGWRSSWWIRIVLIGALVLFAYPNVVGLGVACTQREAMKSLVQTHLDKGTIVDGHDFGPLHGAFPEPSRNVMVALALLGYFVVITIVVLNHPRIRESLTWPSAARRL